MGSCWSDQYSFLGSDAPINHSYSFLGGTNSSVPHSDPKANSQRGTSRKNKKNG